MARKRGNLKHVVKASLEVPGLAKAGSSLSLRLFARGEKLGEISLGRGSLYWYGRYRQKRKRISWTRFFSCFVIAISTGARVASEQAKCCRTRGCAPPLPSGFDQLRGHRHGAGARLGMHAAAWSARAATNRIRAHATRA